MSTIDIQDRDTVIDNWNAAENLSTKLCHPYPMNSIFDENQSVRWNKEEVVRKNEEIKKANAELKERKYAAKQEADKLIVEYLHYYSDEKIKKEVLKKLFEYVWGDNHNETIAYTIQECEDYIDIFLERKYY